jgi:thiol peroxidase
MKIPTIAGVSLGIALLAAAPGFAQQKSTIPHSKDSIAATGDGQSVGMRGRAVELAGNSLKVGDKLPSVTLTGNNMAPVDLAANGGKVRVLNIVPSLDTATCEEQTHELSETNEGLDKQVELVTISMDLPFAQRRFSKEAKIGNVTFLSDYRGGAFGKSAGLLQKQSQLLARAVLVVDKDNVIRHMQVVPDMSTLPDMGAAFKVARGLL